MAALPADLNKLKLTELRDLCKERGLPQKGTKAELIVKLNAHASSQEESGPAAAETASTAAPSEFAPPAEAPSQNATEARPMTEHFKDYATPAATHTEPTVMQVEKPAPKPAAPAQSASSDKQADKMEEEPRAGQAAEADEEAKKTAPGPRMAPRLVPASVNTTGAASAAVGSDQSQATAGASAPARQLTVIRKRKVTETEEAPPAPVRDLPSTKPASAVIKVTNLVRPFTTPALRELLEKHGPLVRFWMDPMKTCCVAEYGSVATATSTRNAVSGLVWPPQFNTKKLYIEFTDTAELDTLLGAKPAATAPKAKEAKTTPAPEQPSKPKGPSLDELFRKTTTKPMIYWLPRSSSTASVAPKSDAPAPAAAVQAPVPVPAPTSAPAAAAPAPAQVPAPATASGQPQASAPATAPK